MPHKNKRSDRWVAQVWDKDSGKRLQLGTFDTKREATAAEVAWYAGAEERAEQAAAGPTITEWRQQWLDLKAENWKPSTLAHNAERTRAFAAEYGDVYLADFNMGHARQWARENESTVGALSAMFGAALEEIDQDGHPLLVVNPFSHSVKRKRAKRDLPDEWLTADDVDHICTVAAGMFGGFGTDAAAMVRFAAETGIRPGELFMLEDADLDVRKGELTIRRAADSKCSTVGPPKTGHRLIVLSSRAAEAARDARRHDAGRGLNPVFTDRQGAPLPYSGKGTRRVFSGPRGLQFWNGSWGYYWRQIRAAAGRPGMDFYELRHYCATRLLEAGASLEDVATQLGHADTRLVAQVYGHPSKRQARDRLRQIMDGNEEAA